MVRWLCHPLFAIVYLAAAIYFNIALMIARPDAPVNLGTLSSIAALFYVMQLTLKTSPEPRPGAVVLLAISIAFSVAGHLTI
ncbi:hypothetical protein [Pseudoalteromonas rubra]|uniref:hypothetical protein n=1 Tax=Pseudoalteromonas rubra TaxID=43658 RepID=UPI002DBA4B91|nr:hypothetical protein [Pseudoalteromonas rubra]MEC4091604.1 hypothetical protein [Pseudoalteromonas rubra]